MAELTDKQEMFCHEYLVDLNATQAYIRVFNPDSYDSARTESSKLKANPNIRARIKELMDIRSANILVDAGYVVESLIEVAKKCQQEEPVLKWDSDSRSMVETGEFQFDSNGANKALELIGKHLGLFTEKVEHSGKVDGFNIIIDGNLPGNDQESA